MNIADRMYKQNKYTSDQIYMKTGKRFKNSVICAGNYVAKRELKSMILDYNPVQLIGDSGAGKMTCVMEIADKNGLDVWVSYNGKDFGDEPIDNATDIYVIRYSKTSKWIKEYIKHSCRVVILTEEILVSYPSILITKPSEIDRQDYAKLKGYPILSYTNPNGITDKGIVMKALRKGISEDEMPDNLAQWFAYNFRTRKVLALCSFADQIKDKFFKHAVLSMIRYKKPISLKIPYGVKRK